MCIYIYIISTCLRVGFTFSVSQMPCPESPAGLCTAMADIYTALMSVAPGQASGASGCAAVPIVLFWMSLFN